MVRVFLPRAGGEPPLNLSAEQVAAAEAAGCSFLPVPPDALHRYAMQRKIFRIAGRGEVLATRGGGLFETASTLERLIAAAMKERPDAAPTPPAPAPRAVGTPAPRRKPVRPAASGATVPATDEAVTLSADAALPPHAPPGAEPARTLPARRRRWQPDPPRWTTAGAARRGRAAVHWSLRAR
jgi:hypothetical protein